MTKFLLIKLFNRFNQLESLLLSTYYKWLFARVGSMRIWGRIKVVYPQNITVGSNCSINYGTFINAYNPVTIGNNVTISAKTMIISTGIDVNSWIRGNKGDKHIKNDGIIISDNVWIGANSMILGGVKITGNNVVIAAGAIITKSFEESNVIIAGCPAKVIKHINKA